MNLFDGLQNAMFSTVTNTMGYSCTWQPQTGDLKSAIVLYNGPTEKEKLFNAEYDPDKLRMEYQAGDLDGLFEAARSKTRLEEVTITDIGMFYVKSVKKKWDGKTFEAQLETKT